ncbi:hypothetical protein CC78DRAFT_559507 [Lojkania enalia]|uniref:Carboxymethylenebutenolidase n=1 Tax=Lojkania enalia TaxID=147567 RepID=A0A9P4KCB0_9PLEO|nr:hypothetical protein CC78DRAFT_559507 [Didymosphaeria enalia]
MMAATARLPIRPKKEYPATVEISPHLAFQPPLSRRGTGPGVILVLDHYAPVERNEDRLDPPPLQKWAEEGFAVVQVLVPGKDDEFPLKRALELLKACEACEFGAGVGLISYLNRIPFYIEEAACLAPEIKAIISYGGKKFSSIPSSAPSLPPQLIHISGPKQHRRVSVSVVPEPEDSSWEEINAPFESVVKEYRYLEAKAEKYWVLPSDEDYHAASASLAHTRSLTFLKPLLNGPFFDIEEVWDEHCYYEFGERDVEKTMSTMVSQPYVNHIPTMTGGIGKDRLTTFYAHHFIHSNPDDISLDLVSRSLSIDKIVDEFVLKMTHDRQVDWLLPAIPPTNKPLQIPFTSVITLRGDRLSHEHIHWDHATVLFQLGLLPEWVPFPYPVEGKMGFEVRVPVVGVEGCRKLAEEGSEASNALIEREVVRVRKVEAGAKGGVGSDW